MSDPSLPGEVAEVCAQFLALADEAEPGLVAGSSWGPPGCTTCWSATR